MRHTVKAHPEINPDFQEWTPFMENVKDDLYSSNRDLQPIDTIFDLIFKDANEVGVFALYETYPSDGHFYLRKPKYLDPIKKNEITHYILLASDMYLFAITKAKTSPSLKDVKNDINRILDYTELLHQSIQRSTFYTKELFHSNLGSYRTNQDEYRRCTGEGLPAGDDLYYDKEHSVTFSWMDKLNSLCDLMHIIKDEIGMFSNPTKGDIYTKINGDADFILTYNCYTLYKSIYGKASGYRNSKIAKLSEMIKCHALRRNFQEGWAGDHIRSIHQWYRSVDEIKELIEGAKEFLQEHCLLPPDDLWAPQEYLRQLVAKERILLGSPGRIPETRSTSRGNISLFKDPMSPLVIDPSERDL